MAVVAFYCNREGKPKHVKCYSNWHALTVYAPLRSALSERPLDVQRPLEDDGQPPAPMQCSNALTGNAIIPELTSTVNLNSHHIIIRNLFK